MHLESSAAPPQQTEETVHALKCYVDHLCGSVVPVVLQSVGLIDQASACWAC